MPAFGLLPIVQLILPTIAAIIIGIVLQTIGFFLMYNHDVCGVKFGLLCCWIVVSIRQPLFCCITFVYPGIATSHVSYVVLASSTSAAAAAAAVRLGVTIG